MGASGSLFGVVGLYLADIAVNFETMQHPLIQLAVMVISIVITVAFQLAMPGAGGRGVSVSHATHVGGLITGLCVAFIFLPNLKENK